MDWDLAIKRNSEALKGIIAGLFAMLELAGGITVARIPHSVHSAVRRVLWPAESALRRLIVIAARGLVVKLPPARPVSRPKPVGSIRKGGGSRLLLPALRSAEKLRAAPPPKSPRGLNRASMSWRMIPRGCPCGQRPGPRRPPRSALRWPGQCRTPHPEASDPQVWPSRICRARPGVLPAGGQGARPCQVRSSDHRSGLAVLPATAGSPFTWSMRCSSNAMASPGTR